MTQPPDGYPAPEPGQRPPPADPFYGPPSWEPPTQPAVGGGGAPPPYLPPQHTPPSSPFPPPPGPPAPQSGPPGTPSAPPASHGGPPASPGPYGGPPASPGPYGQPGGPYQQPASPSPYDPASGAPYGPPGGPPPYGPPAGPPGGGMSPRRKKGLLILGAALAGVLVLCAGGGIGGWLLLRDSDRDGAATPTAAVQSFLQAVYRDQDPTAAAALVCAEARDEDALSAKVDEVRTYQDAQVDPRFQWTNPQIVDEGDELAVVAVTLTMITGDEKVAEQSMRVSVLDKDPHGWWVCNVETTDEPGDPADADTDDAEGDADDGEQGDADEDDDDESADD